MYIHFVCVNMVLKMIIALFTILVAKQFIASTTDCRDYGAFEWPKIMFDSSYSRAAYERIPDFRNLKEVGYPTAKTERRKSYTFGCVTVHHQASVDGIQEMCGWNDNLKISHEKKKNHRKAICPIVCPESWSWQHFLDGALPKLYHALPVIRLYNATVLIQKPRDSIVLWILNRIPGLIFEIFEHGGYSADIIIDPCNTPFMNPRVWRGMQKLINPVRAPSRILWDFVLFVRRSKTRNGGRKILNEEKVVQTLNYNGRGVVVDPSDCNTDVIVNLMQQTKL